MISKRIFLIQVFVLIAMIFSAFSAFAKDSDDKLYHVIRVIDGDTFKANGAGTIRLIGVDTPETKHPKKKIEYFGREASDFLKKRLSGKKVRLEYDQQRKDRYGRTLAYVYLEDSTFINAEIIAEGYGFAYTKFPFKYLEEFRSLEKRARESEKGLWKNKKSSMIQMPIIKPVVANLKAECRPKTCSKIKSCSEAMHLLNHCGQKSLDRDSDGVPCESLCRFVAKRRLTSL